jgi:hypothetical protein
MKEDQTTPWTMSVPAAGLKYYGLKKNASYRAAARGEMPAIRVGKLLKALPRVIEAQLTKESEGREPCR